VNDFALNPLVELPQPHKDMTVFIAIDPTSGVRSELAIVSLYVDMDHRVIVRNPWRRLRFGF